MSLRELLYHLDPPLAPTRLGEVPHLRPRGQGNGGHLPEVREPGRVSQPDEGSQILTEFAKLLALPVSDGQRKRAKGTKPSWKVDQDHEPALWRHLGRWKAGELVDPDSGAHPLTHAAFRCLALAWQDMNP